VTARRRGGDQQIPRPTHWTADAAAPWEDDGHWSVERLVRPIAAQSAPLLPAFPEARHSAVLIALVEGDRGAEVLLTRRSMSMRNHRGEISFPGGRMDPGETPVDTALREAHEEVGLDPELPTIVGELAHLSTVVSRSYIVPVVSVLPERPELAPRTAEVDRVLWTSIDDLTREGTYHLERWGQPPLDRSLHFFELDDETVWGATAHMLVELLTATVMPR
jgi:8-oxo-dGTP pyrophosphatase MutT (NUDIX family)